MGKRDKEPFMVRSGHIAAAMIERGLLDLMNPNPDIKESAQLWVDEINNRTYGFDWCCGNVGKDPEQMRKLISTRQASGEKLINAVSWRRVTTDEEGDLDGDTTTKY